MKTALSTSLLTIAVMAVSSPSFAQAEGAPEVMEGASNVTIVDGDAVSIECITQAEVDAMTAEDKEKLTLPVCDDAKSNEAGKKAEEKNAK
jgi:hypothetical protein